ncbi:hypothetical protein ACH5RR_014029 [Cinchona calisaya]|uniref:Protein kinase domain-containing protein n=1 Tax=Cinchona calisaya TaxID=153742 RepID=A0ABD3A1R8_9GENT
MTSSSSSSCKISFDLHLWWRILVLILHLRIQYSDGLNTDGVLLLSLKYNILEDPLGVLHSWNYHNETPCSWYGVSCEANRVTNLSLPNSQLLGSLPSNLGMIPFLKILDLSNNSINGSLPLYLFSASQLRILDFSNNLISGELPENIGGLKSLQLLNLSDNALAGNIPENLSTLSNLTVISLKNNYFFGTLPSGFQSVEFLDLSSNLMNGSLPTNFGGSNFRYLNLSFNRFSGEIPPEFGDNFPSNETIDLSFNNFTGEIPDSGAFLNQDLKSFSGNLELCGLPLKKLCPIPSSIATQLNSSAPTSPPAIAAIPKTIDSNSAVAFPNGGANQPSPQRGNGMRITTILGIIVGDIMGIGILALVFIYVYKIKKRKSIKSKIEKEAESAKDFDWASSSSSASSSGEREHNWLRAWTCLRKQRNEEDCDETSQEAANSGIEDNQQVVVVQRGHENNANLQEEKKNGALVTLDGEKELELETLLKASAYILGATGSSIMYKAVLEDGTTLAVRRIGESGVERFRDFENQIKVIAKLVHPNLVKIRGFYWGADEKLIIYDFVPNGSLANARYRKAGSSPCHVPWEMRLKIAKGVARGLCYIHDKKHVHANLKPNNILLGVDMEPKIGDFGLERIVNGENSSKASGSSRIFGSKRSTASRDSFQDFTFGPTPSPSPSVLGISPYHAPESLRTIKPNPKWDVYAFGVILLELLTGKIIVSDETGLGPLTGATTLHEEEKNQVLKMADVAIRADLEGKEEALLGLLRVGYSCISAAPQKRPTMKEVLQALEKFPCSSSYYYGL